MRDSLIRSLFLASALLFSLLLRAQPPVAAFSSNITSGCAPLSVSFRDESTGKPVFWSWDFGNSAISNAQNPTTTFNTPGTYKISLVVRNADGTNGTTKDNYITVFPSPSVAFEADLTVACQPATISFRDLSSSTVGTITSWEWNFGDGATSTQRNPTHTYADNGFYTVSLKITSTSGCPASTAYGRYIRVVSGVKADFDPTVDATCVAPFNTQFNNQTSGPGALSYLWRFHDGSTSTDPNPERPYTATGNYNVKLVATSDLGCKDSIVKPVTVNGADVNFTAPVGACINTPHTFTNTSSTGATGTVWDFGDGTQSTASNPVKTYTSAGTYTVTLTGIYPYCNGTISKQIIVSDPPLVNFTANETAACKAPFSVNFTAAAPDAVKWSWNFGDGSPVSTQPNPTHQYNSIGDFNVTLTITNANNCTNTITKNAFIKVKPSEIIKASDAEGCLNYIYQPIANNHISVISPDPIVSYLWNWGDGSPTSTGINASHTYTTQGAYTVTLTVTTAGGCPFTTSFANAVLIGTPVIPDFTVDKSLICDKDIVQFTNASTPVGDKWEWTFSDGGSSSLENPTHSFSGKGTYSATLTVRNKGCYRSITHADIVEVQVPTSRFEFKLVNCTDPLTYSFTSTSDTSLAPLTSTYDWQFGTGNSTNSNTTFTFPGFGTYPVTLNVKDDLNGCESTSTQDIIVFKESASLTATKVNPCKNEAITLAATVAQPQNITTYDWQINGVPVLNKPASWDTSFAIAGDYDITVTLTDINSCTFTENAPIKVIVAGPTALFDIPKNKGCKNVILSFTDQSTAPAGIQKVEWNWGDGTTTSGPTLTHQYTDTGSFSVKLTVTDNNNCIDILEYADTIKIRQPFAGFTAAHTLFCRGGELMFTDTSKGHGLSYEWTFGDGKTSTDPNPIQIYEGADNKYTVSLKITDDAGCESFIEKTNYIEIKSPKPAFTVSDSISLCRLFETKFTFAGSDYTSFSWDFGDDATSTTKDPTHFYNEFGNYTAKLYLTGYGGCIDSAVHSIQVIAANSNMISYNVLPFECNEMTVDFTLIPPPSVNYVFYYGDGQFDDTKQLMLTHLYTNPNTYSPSLFMTDNQGCQASAGGAVPIMIKGGLPFYSQDRKAFCDEGEVVFTNYIQSNEPIISYVWDLGDNTQSSTDPNIIHRYTAPGTYITSLTVNTESGCTKTLTDTVRVYRTPDPSILSNDIVCINDQLDIQGSLAVSDTLTNWKWSFGNNKTDTGQIVNTLYNDSGNFTINLVAANLLGCNASTSKTISVKPLPEVNVAIQPVIPVRTEITMPVTYSPNVVTYTWTPAKDLSCTSCPTPIANPQFTTKYNIAVVDEFGCRASDDVTITVICNETNYFIPNTFSPNGDGNNDLFYPRGKGIYNVVSMRIFNRWGEMVFEKRNFPDNDAASGWNGFYKGKPANADVYLYIVEVVCDNAQVIPLKGNVTLLR